MTKAIFPTVYSIAGLATIAVAVLGYLDIPAHREWRDTTLLFVLGLLLSIKGDSAKTANIERAP